MQIRPNLPPEIQGCICEERVNPPTEDEKKPPEHTPKKIQKTIYFIILARINVAANEENLAQILNLL